MHPFKVLTACLVFLVACTLSHEIEPANKGYVSHAGTNLLNRTSTEWNSRRNSVANSVSRRRKTFSVRSKRQLPNMVLFLDANARSEGTNNNSFAYIQEIPESYGVLPGGSCQKSEHCTRQSVCREGTCVCQDGYVTSGFDCVRETSGKDDECYSNYECQRYLKQSICSVTPSGMKCRCLPNYVIFARDCLEKVGLGDRCRTTLQCPPSSFCTGYLCVCKSGYVRKGDECLQNSPYLRTPNFLLALIAGVVCLIVVSCLFVTILSIRRKLRSAIRQANSDAIPTISSQMDAREPFYPDPAFERIDKPPSYEEAMSSSSTSVLTLSLQDSDTSSEPPAYSQVQEQHRNVNNTT